MSYIRGPFIEYECVECGSTIQENAPRNTERLDTLIMEKNAFAEKRVCAQCFDWSGAQCKDVHPIWRISEAGRNAMKEGR